MTGFETIGSAALTVLVDEKSILLTNAWVYRISTLKVWVTNIGYQKKRSIALRMQKYFWSPYDQPKKTRGFKK